MSRPLKWLLALAIATSLPSPARACLWDYDTLKQERASFPEILELITGKFLRHSKEFYEWRIQDRLARLEIDPLNLALHDDLAVAYEKTGQHEKALATMLAKDRIQPGLYETYSNLGTLYILAGDFDQGLPYLDKALAINPNAHFGREKYQKWLVEFALKRRPTGKLSFPLRYNSENQDLRSDATFGRFLETQLAKQRLTEDDIQEAVRGVAGMMRFANHANPLLLEALGDLLSYSGHQSDPKRLAARCYLKASYEMDDPLAKRHFRKLAEDELVLQFEHNLPQLESEFTQELADAQTWYAALRDQEIAWIKAGKNVDAEFDQLYTEPPQVVELPDPPIKRKGGFTNGFVVAGTSGIFIAIASLLAWIWLRRRPLATSAVS